MTKAAWIVVTGLDGSGKTTLVSNLVQHYETKGLRVYRDRFPHDDYLVHTLLDKSKDAYTDRLLFALDNRIFGTELKEKINSGDYDVVITQRGFLDSFVHGSVQGYDYSWIESLNKLSDLPRCDIMIHMVAESTVAYARIKGDPDADKFEYPDYIRKQEEKTREVYSKVVQGVDPGFVTFNETKNIYIDTTAMTQEEVFQLAKSKLEKFF